MLHSFCIEIQEAYQNTRECNNQKWLMIDLEDDNRKYEDVKIIISVAIDIKISIVLTFWFFPFPSCLVLIPCLFWIIILPK